MEKAALSPLHTNKFHSESMFVSHLFISPTKSTHTTNTVGYIELYCNRFIILSTQIDKKQTHKINIFNLTV